MRNPQCEVRLKQLIVAWLPGSAHASGLACRHFECSPRAERTHACTTTKTLLLCDGATCALVAGEPAVAAARADVRHRPVAGLEVYVQPPLDDLEQHLVCNGDTKRTSMSANSHARVATVEALKAVAAD